MIPSTFTQTEQAVTYWLAPEHTLMQRLAERRISAETIAVFGIQPWGNGWRYPVPGGGYHWKNTDSQAADKYRWPDGKPETAVFYHAQDLAAAIAQADGACWYVSGQPDTWAMHSAGIPYVLSGFTEAQVPEGLAAYLQDLGVLTLYIAPDLDSTGARWAQLVYEALRESSIELDARALPEELGEHGDLGKVWATYAKRQPFERYLLGLPRFEPEPSLPNVIQPVTTDIRAVPEGYRRMIADILGVTGWKADGNSLKNVSCPFHDDRHPSATLHIEKGLYCHTCGRLYLWNETGVKIGAGSITEWRLTNQPYAISTELREALITTGLTCLSRLLDVLALAGWKPGREFTRKDAVCASSGVLSPKTIRTAVTVLDTYCPFFTPFSLEQVRGEKRALSHKSRPAKVYKLPRLAELTDLLADKYGMEVQPMHFDDMPVEKIKHAADYRAEVYAALPRRRPGQYTRRTLAARVGVTNQTARTYDKRAGLIVTPNIDKQELTLEEINNLPKELPKDRRYNLWLEDERGQKYPPVKKVAEWITERGKVYRIEQHANTYEGARP
jgi:hypothetical protein